MDSNHYILLWNLRSQSSVAIAPGLSIRPLTRPLTIFDLAGAGAVGFREWSTLDVMAHGCTSEIESAKDAAITPGYDALNRAWLACAMMTLKGCGKILPVAVSSYSWDNIAGFQKRNSGVFQGQIRAEGVEAAVHSPQAKLPPFSGGLLEYRLKFLLVPTVSSDSLTEGDALWLHANFERFNALSARSERFRFALESGTDWRFAHDARAAIARIWAGIEALFGISAELVYRLSITAASLLRPRGSTRVDYASFVKRLYGVRSKAVHGDAIDEGKLFEALDQSFILLRDLLFLMAERGNDFSETDLQQAVLG